MFWPFKTLFHTYTHTLSCIPGKFPVFYRVLDPLGYQMGHNIDDIDNLNRFNEWGTMAYLSSDHDRPLGTCSKVDPLKLV